MTKRIVLRSKFSVLQKSIGMMIVMFIIVLSVSIEEVQLLFTPFILLPIVYLIVFETKYVLVVRDSAIRYKLRLFFIKKILMEFDTASIDSLFVKQLENKFYAGFIKIKDGREVLLDSRATLDQLELRMKDIKDDLRGAGISVKE